MVFALILLIFVGLIAFFHYTQGLWSATISAVIAVFAAVIAVAYHEPVVEKLLKGAMADQAHAIALVGLFALVYVTCRLVFDAAVPGNIRLPAIVDKVGGAVMGVIAGVFATGVLAIAAQTLPFGPSILGYSRYALADTREVTVANPFRSSGQQLDTVVVDELEGDALLEENRKGLFVPVDDIVVNAVAGLSDGGSLAGKRPMTTVHPSYLDELFAGRLGLQVGAKRTALNVGGKEQIKLGGVFELPAIGAQIDAESSKLRTKPVAHPTRPPAGEMFLVVRTTFDINAGDNDKSNMVRISPGAVRLVANGRNHYPIGTLGSGGTTLYANKPDDFLFVPEGKAADWVFLVPAADVLDIPGDKEAKVNDGVFVEVKRLAKLDLAGQAPGAYKASADVAVLRKGSAGSGGGATISVSADPNAPIQNAAASVANKLFSAISIGSADKDGKGITVGSGTVDLRGGRFTKLDISPTESLQRMAQGATPIDELFVPEGKKLIVVTGRPPASEGNAWQWATELTQFELLDASGGRHKPHGGWAKVRQGQADMMFAGYNAESPIPALSAADGRPLDVYVAFMVPAGTQLRTLNFKGKPIAAVNLVAN